MTQDVYTQEQAKALLDRLIDDQSFRERLLGDPVSALAELGIKADPTQVSKTRSLPSVEVLRANRKAIEDKLVGNARLFIFMVD